MFDFLKRNKRVCGAHAPQFRRGTNPPRPSKTHVYKAPPMPDTAPCKDEFKSVWFDENGACHYDEVYVTIGDTKYKILGIERVDFIPKERTMPYD